MRIDQSIEKINHCILCEDTAGTPDRHFEGLLGLVEPYGVLCCPRCKLRWLSPRPTTVAYSQLYSNDHYFGEDNVVESYAELASQRVAYFESRIAEIERLLPKPRPLKLLDVGAATGEFVHEARKSGHQAFGIEFSEDARRTAYDLYKIELYDHGLEDEEQIHQYDVIHMNHVFEHLPDPKASLEACRGMLQSDGMLVVEVPREFYNDLDRLKKLLGVSKTPVFNAYSLHHTYFYSPYTICKLFKQHGLSIVRMRTAVPARTPLHPFSLKNLLLRAYLGLSDWLHRGGNIIEVYARPTPAA